MEALTAYPPGRCRPTTQKRRLAPFWSVGGRSSFPFPPLSTVSNCLATIIIDSPEDGGLTIHSIGCSTAAMRLSARQAEDLRWSRRGMKRRPTPTCLRHGQVEESGSLAGAVATRAELPVQGGD